MIISISGMDNAGKTTQCQILKAMYPNVFKSILHIKDMPSFDVKNFDSDWWFKEDNALEFTHILFKCLKERIDYAREEKDKIILFDKGTDFYDARIMATLIIKGMTYKKAESFTKEIKKEYLNEDYEDLKLFLESGRYKRSNIDLSSQEGLRYNAYIELNKLILKQMTLDYIHIPANDTYTVTNTILGCIEYNLGEHGKGDDGFCRILKK